MKEITEEELATHVLTGTHVHKTFGDWFECKESCYWAVGDGRLEYFDAVLARVISYRRAPKSTSRARKKAKGRPA